MSGWMKISFEGGERSPEFKAFCKWFIAAYEAAEDDEPLAMYVDMDWRTPITAYLTPEAAQLAVAAGYPMLACPRPSSEDVALCTGSIFGFHSDWFDQPRDERDRLSKERRLSPEETAAWAADDERAFA